jgi:hypothetical protein
MPTHPRDRFHSIVAEAIEVDHLTINGASVTDTAVLLGEGDLIDMNGEADALVLDADADTTISAPTDDQIDIEISGADDFTFTANTFTALSGSTIKTNTIAETTSANGVTIDGVLLKDGGAVFADAATIEIDTVNEATSAAGVTIDGLLVKDNTLQAWKRNVIAKSADFNVATAESGCIYEIGGVDKVATLPATAPGLQYRFVLAAAGLSSGTGFSVSPNASDKIMGNGFTSADNKDAILAGSGDREGDMIELTADAAGAGWYITGVIGTWTRE